MTIKEQYQRSHRIAKVIVCMIVIALLILGWTFGHVLFDAIAVVVWFFGVNPIGYLVESMLHFKHRHNKF